ncbi:hypothetical protein [Methylotetracoccus oryzae]|uniref:hypothetical protein n=1 Tax=Methylotetracoccus oryzae TaxID=1919059 RepID=UPI00111A6D5F|nr:hypothetical protein [Methylotetracoccus oryzae]
MSTIILKDSPRPRPGSQPLTSHRLTAAVPTATSSGSATVAAAHPLPELGLLSAALFHLLLLFELLPVAFPKSCLISLLYSDALAFLLLFLRPLHVGQDDCG